MRGLAAVIGSICLLGAAALAQSPPLAPTTTPPATAPATPPTANDKRVAKVVFGAHRAPADLAPRAIGYYSKGCLAGARMLPVDGPAWQAMRLSRNRNWGHPTLVGLIERLARDAKQQDTWPGLLVGDMAQPRGGPMLTGHASHQIGLDADIWLTPMPDRRLTAKEREEMSAVNMVAPSKISIDPAVWTEAHVKLIRRAAIYPEVERVLVHPAIKKALCASAGTDRAWLKKVRPIWGHDHHFHIRMACPASSPNCRTQSPPPADEGCTTELEDWFRRLTRPIRTPDPAAPPVKPPPPLTVDQLPAECKALLVPGEAVARLRVPKRTAVRQQQ